MQKHLSSFRQLSQGLQLRSLLSSLKNAVILLGVHVERLVVKDWCRQLLTAKRGSTYRITHERGHYSVCNKTVSSTSVNAKNDVISLYG